LLHTVMFGEYLMRHLDNLIPDYEILALFRFDIIWSILGIVRHCIKKCFDKMWCNITVWYKMWQHTIHTIQYQKTIGAGYHPQESDCQGASLSFHQTGWYRTIFDQMVQTKYARCALITIKTFCHKIYQNYLNMF